MTNYEACVRFARIKEQDALRLKSQGVGVCEVRDRKERVRPYDRRRPSRIIPEPGDDEIIREIERECEAAYSE